MKLKEEFQLFLPWLRAIAWRRYKRIPFSLIVKVVLSIAYTLFWVDLIPDFIPFFGYLDDFSVWLWILHEVRKELALYREFLKSNSS